MVIMQDGVRQFLQHEDEDDAGPDIHLPEDSKERIRASLLSD
jgi:hypothetical protein